MKKTSQVTLATQLAKEMVGLDNYENESKKMDKELRRKHHRHRHMYINWLYNNKHKLITSEKQEKTQ